MVDLSCYWWWLAALGVCMSFDDFCKKRKRAYVKPKFWVRCLDCRAIYSDRVYQGYDTCKFCNGANWSSDH